MMRSVIHAASFSFSVKSKLVWIELEIVAGAHLDKG
jgi:hypothetical protein